jgi:chromosome segregation ATPase
MSEVDIHSSRSPSPSFQSIHPGSPAKSSPLADENRMLQRENAQLRAQFEDALRLASQIDKVTDKNTLLGNDLRSAQARIAELTDRLDILTRANKDLERRLSNQKEGQVASLRQESTSFEKQLESLTQSKEKADAELRRLSAISDAVLQRSSHYFDVTFTSFHDLLAYFGQNVTQETAIADHSKRSPRVLKMQKELSELINEKEIQTSLHRKELRDLQDRFERNQAELESANFEQQRGINELQDKIGAFAAENERLQKDNGRILRQLRSAQDKSGAHAAQLKQLESENSVLDKANAQLKIEYGELENRYTVVAKELELLRDSRTVDYREKSQLERKIDSLEELIESQRVKIAELSRVAVDKGAENDELTAQVNENEKILHRFIAQVSGLLSIEASPIGEAFSVRSVEALATRIIDLKAELDRRDLEGVEARNQMRGLKQKLKQALAAGTSFKARVDEMESQIREWQRRVSEKEIDLETQRQGNASARSLLNAKENECERLLAEIAGLDNRRAEAEAEIEDLRREVARVNAAAKNGTAALESDCQTRLDIQQAKWQREKGRIFAFVIDQFRQFFTAGALADEAAFKSVVLRARDELAKFRSSDRAIRRLLQPG